VFYIAVAQKAISAGTARAEMSVRLSVRLSVCFITDGSDREPQDSSFCGYIRLIQKFEMGRLERGRFMRLEWVQTGDF